MLEALIIAVLVSQINLALSVDCNAPWVKHRSLCLYKEPTVGTQMENLKKCKAVGGTLVSVDNENQRQAVQSFLTTGNWKYINYWLGGLRGQGCSEFAWINGKDFSYKIWNYNQPDNQNDPGPVCVHMTTMDGWDDDPCDNKNNLLCQKLDGAQSKNDKYKVQCGGEKDQKQNGDDESNAEGDEDKDEAESKSDDNSESDEDKDEAESKSDDNSESDEDKDEVEDTSDEKPAKGEEDSDESESEGDESGRKLQKKTPMSRKNKEKQKSVDEKRKRKLQNKNRGRKPQKGERKAKSGKRCVKKFHN